MGMVPLGHGTFQASAFLNAWRTHRRETETENRRHGKEDERVQFDLSP